jgi:hypothetical protein
MKRSRRILLFAVLLFAIIAAWLWWVRPKKVDMAIYAPADSLLYLEANHPSEVVDAITGTQAWKALESAGGRPRSTQTPWLRAFVAWTGLGPIQSVILARAQIAVVLTDLRAAEAGSTLNIKPEGAILIETHTGERRIKPAFEEALKTLAEMTYGRPTARRVVLDGVEYIEWIAPDNSRQIVGAVVGSLLIIGTNEHVVQNCLEVTQGRRPNLKDDPELRTMRLQLGRNGSLTFGYVPAVNSARLLAVGVPLLLGRAPGDAEFQRLITNGATKVFGSLGWASTPYLTGIEDRYVITLQPSVVARLRPSFGSTNLNSQMEQLVPHDVYSVTSYKFANPAAAWQGLQLAVSSQVDALSTIVFSSLLKSALLSYGIEDPARFLGAVNGQLLTLRLDEGTDRSILVAGVRDRATLQRLVTKKMTPSQPILAKEPTEIFEDSEGEFAVSLSDEVIVMGLPEDVRRYAEIRIAGSTLSDADKLKRIAFFVSPSNSANVVTYADDSDRVRSFIYTIATAKGVRTLPSGQIEGTLATLPYSVTESTLVDSGIERVTRSPLGQFSTLLPLLFPEKPGLSRQ